MSDKWKDGNKESIIKRIDDVIAYLNCGAVHEHETIINILTRSEPVEPLIVKSGETWVAYWEGVDYLCTLPDPDWIIGDVLQDFDNDIDHLGIDSSWKSFTGSNPDIVELTDEIAKLRPMVRFKNEEFAKLIYTEGQFHTVIVRQNDSDEIEYFDHWNICHLATAKELKQAQE